MSTDLHQHHGPQTLADQVRAGSSVAVARCYQCGKCSAGCPLAADMDYPPSLIMHMLQLGLPALEDKVLRSLTIWLCLACETCYTRCPMEIDIPKMMDVLRHEALRQKKAHRRAKDIIAFHRAFLDPVRYTGRLYEIGMIASYKARSWHLLQDVLLAPFMYLKGKIHLIPERIKDRAQLRRIFARTLKNKEVQP